MFIILSQKAQVFTYLQTFLHRLMSVKGAISSAKPFTLDGQAVFCYSRLFRHPVSIVHGQLGVDDRPVLSTACPFLRDIHHGQIQHFQQTVIRGENSLGLGHLAKLTVETLDCVGRIDQPSKLFREFEIGARWSIW